VVGADAAVQPVVALAAAGERVDAAAADQGVGQFVAGQR
jgi:hypothetical protein